MNKEDNIKEKFKQALQSTYKVISDDYKVVKNKKNDEKVYDIGEIDNINDKNQFKKLRAETDSEALKRRFSNRKLLDKNNPQNPSCRTLYQLAEKVRYELLGSEMLKGISKNFRENYKNRLNNLPDPSGAVVFYSALKKEHIKKTFSNHYQFVSKEFCSLFVSISDDGDGRAPKGEVTLIASIFTKTKDWFDLDKQTYLKKKNGFMKKISLELESQFDIDPEKWLHRELATPLGFEKWTNRPNGIVGGLGQNPDIFGLFGLSSRTPFEGLWLCGDSIYPGEGTAGVSQSALMVSRQILASKGIENFNL